MSKYPSPQAVFLDPKQDIIDILLNSRKDLKLAEEKHPKLIESTKNVQIVSLKSPMLSTALTTSISLYEAIDTEICKLLKEIKGFIDSDEIPLAFSKNISLLMSKRGTMYGRRTLYAAALASIRTKRNGEGMNQVLFKYYKENLKGKIRFSRSYAQAH